MFQVGDEVVCVDASDLFVGGLVEGQTYTVSHIFRPGERMLVKGSMRLWRVADKEMCAVWVHGGADFGAGVEGADGHLAPGYRHTRFSKVQKRNDRLTIEAFSVIKDGFEEPKRAPAKTPAKEKA